MADEPQDWGELHNSLVGSLTSPESMAQHPEIPKGPITDPGKDFATPESSPLRYFRGDESIRHYAADVGDSYQAAMSKAGIPEQDVKEGRGRIEEIARQRARQHVVETMKATPPGDLAQFVPGLGRIFPTVQNKLLEDSAPRFNAGEASATDYQNVAHTLGAQSDEEQRGWWAKRGRQLLGLGQFAGEMALTGGPGGALAESAVAGIGLKGLGGFAARKLAYGAGATAAMPQRIAAEYLEGNRHLALDEQGGLTVAEPDDEGARLWKATASNYIDNTIFPAVGVFEKGSGKYVADVFRKTLTGMATGEASQELKYAASISPQGGPAYRAVFGDPRGRLEALKDLAGDALTFGIFEGAMQAGRRGEKVDGDKLLQKVIEIRSYEAQGPQPGQEAMPQAPAAPPAAPAPQVAPESAQAPVAVASPPEPGMVRFYHGGEPGKGPRWLTPDPKYAQGYADKSGSPVSYVDLPENHPLLSKAFDDSGTNVKAPYNSFEAPEEIARNLKPVAPEPAKPSPERLETMRQFLKALGTKTAGLKDEKVIAEARKMGFDQFEEKPVEPPVPQKAATYQPAEQAPPQPGSEGKPTFPPPERRSDAARRKRVAEMTPDERGKELLSSQLVDLPNRRAFDEAEPAPVVGMSDADGLKAFNDKFGYQAGDALLNAKAEALKAAGVDAYHEKGDEFLHRGEEPEALKAKLEKARSILRDSTIEVTLKDGSVKRYKGADFSFGVGHDLAAAEAGLKAHKGEREARGERARGELRGITEVGPEARPSGESPPAERQGGAKPAEVKPAAERAQTMYDQQRRSGKSEQAAITWTRNSFPSLGEWTPALKTGPERVVPGTVKGPETYDPARDQDTSSSGVTLKQASDSGFSGQGRQGRKVAPLGEARAEEEYLSAHPDATLEEVDAHVAKVTADQSKPWVVVASTYHEEGGGDYSRHATEAEAHAEMMRAKERFGESAGFRFRTEKRTSAPPAGRAPEAPPAAPATPQPAAGKKPEPPTAPGQRMTATDLHDKLMRGEAVSGLTKRQQDDFKLHVVDGLSFEEIGKRRGVTKQAIQASTDKALQALHGMIEEPPEATVADRPEELLAPGDLPNEWAEHPILENLSDALNQHVVERANGNRPFTDAEAQRIVDIQDRLDRARPNSAGARKAVAEASAFFNSIGYRVTKRGTVKPAPVRPAGDGSVPGSGAAGESAPAVEGDNGRTPARVEGAAAPGGGEAPGDVVSHWDPIPPSILKLLNDSVASGDRVMVEDLKEILDRHFSYDDVKAAWAAKGKFPKGVEGKTRKSTAQGTPRQMEGGYRKYTVDQHVLEQIHEQDRQRALKAGFAPAAVEESARLGEEAGGAQGKGTADTSFDFGHNDPDFQQPPPAGESTGGLRGLADRLEKEGRDSLQGGFENFFSGESGAVDLDKLSGLAKLVAARIIKGGYSATDFARDAIRKFGEEVKPHLAGTWNRAVGMAKLLADDGKTPTSVKNAITEQERAKAGLPPHQPVDPVGHSFPELRTQVLDIAQNDPGRIDRLISEVRGGKVPTTDLDQSLILYRENQTRIKWADATRAKVDNQRAGMASPLDAVVERDAKAALDDITTVANKIGTVAGRTLAARRMMVNEDFSLANMHLMLEAAKGSPLTDAEKFQLIDFHDKITASQGKLDLAEKAFQDRPSAQGSKAALIEKQLDTARGQVNQMAEAGLPDALKEANRKVAELQAQLEATKKPLPGLQGAVIGDPAYKNMDAARVTTERAKGQFKEQLTTYKQQQRSWGQRLGDLLIKLRVNEVISGPVTLAKIVAASGERMISTPLEEAAGAVWSKFPGLSKIAALAPRQGAGLKPGVEARSLWEGLTQGLKDSWQTIRTGKSDIDVQHGRQGVPREWLDLQFSLHDAMKAPAVRNEYTRSMLQRIDAGAAKGEDVSSPAALLRIQGEAYKDAQAAKFRQENWLVDAYNKGVNSLRQADKPWQSQVSGTVLKVLTPVVRIPTNLAFEVAQHVFGVAEGTRAATVAFARGLENLKPQQAEYIMRNFKKGSLGIAALAIGYLNPDMFGGYYSGKRDDKDVKAGSARIGGVDIPSFLMHNPLLEVFQVGATVRRASDKIFKGQEQGTAEGVMQGARGWLEEVPMVREGVDAAKVVSPSPKERGHYLGETFKSFAVPQLFQWLAGRMDVKPGQNPATGEPTPRKPTGFLQHLKTGVPGLRQTVPAK